MANGVEVGWLVDPEERRVHIYEAGAAARIEASDEIAGTGPVDGFVLDATEVWRGYE